MRIRAPDRSEADRLSHARVRHVYLSALGVVYLCAYWSIWRQAAGLFGSDGLLPVTYAVEWAGNQGYGFWDWPTLFWLQQSDALLNGVCIGGMVLSLLVITGFLRLPCLVLLWFGYLSLYRIGAYPFFGLQWDTLLLEAGFLALFFTPLSLRPRLSEPSPFSLWMHRWLLFRLVFASGVVKLLADDPAWREFTAMDFHHWTQPLPTFVGYHLHHLPGWFHRIEVGITLLVELVVPFLIFFRRTRFIAFCTFVAFQLAIAISGNYGFFNLLTIALCITLLDGKGPRRAPTAFPSPVLWARRIALSSLLVLTTSQFARGLDVELPEAPRALDRWRLASSYGLFASMTTHRHEVIIEGSDNGREWQEYGFSYKPGDPARAPMFCPPHMPRVDWMLWFAALRGYDRSPWVSRLLYRLLDGAPDVVALLGHDPFEGRPPRYVRAMLYRYEFTKPDEEGWWKRTKLGLFSPVLWK